MIDFQFDLGLIDALFPLEKRVQIPLNKDNGSNDSCDQSCNSNQIRIQKQERRIQKRKKKLLAEFGQKSKSPEEPYESKSSVLGSYSTNQKKRLVLMAVNRNRSHTNYYHLGVPRGISEIMHFLFSGFINVEVAEIEVNRLFEFYGIRIQQVEKRHGYYSAHHLPYEFSHQYDAAIHLLESSQNLQSYETAQELRVYKKIMEEKSELALQRFANEAQTSLEYPDRMNWFTEMQQRRKEYRDSLTDMYIRCEFSEDDAFFFCCDGGINFENGTLGPSKFRVSANVFALLGVEDADIENYLMRNDTFTKMIPYQSRRRLTTGILKLRTGERQAAQMAKEKKLKEVLRDFEIHTLDGITIICELIISMIVVKYPEALAFVRDDSDLQNERRMEENEMIDEMELIQSFQFVITSHHLDRVLRERKIMEERNERVQCSLFQDFEYAMMSSMFIEKYYSRKESGQQFNEESEVGIQEGKKEKIQRLKKNRCGFKQIVS